MHLSHISIQDVRTLLRFSSLLPVLPCWEPAWHRGQIPQSSARQLLHSTRRRARKNLGHNESSQSFSIISNHFHMYFWPVKSSHQNHLDQTTETYVCTEKKFVLSSVSCTCCKNWSVASVLINLSNIPSVCRTEASARSSFGQGKPFKARWSIRK